jgi:hypothetical protein
MSRGRSARVSASLARACLWLLLVLLPLRGFAAVQMVSPGGPQGWAAAACHDIVASPAETPHPEPQPASDPVDAQLPVSGACACGLFCAPALPGAAAAFAALSHGASTLPLAESGAMPEGVRDALFRPPRD